MMANEPLEIWKDVVGYEKIYQISNFGKLRSSHRRKCETDEYYYKKIGIKDKDGYFVTSINKNGRQKSMKIHRLVALHFVDGHSEEKNSVNHIDGNKENNHYTNLEWVTPEDNNKHAWKNGLFDGVVKAQLSRERNRVLQIDSNNMVIGNFKSATEAKRRLGVDDGDIGKCCKGKRKSVNGFVWVYEKDYDDNENYSNRVKQKTYEAVSPNGEKIIFFNQSEFARKYNLTSTNISSCIKGKIEFHKGWSFSEVNLSVNS